LAGKRESELIDRAKRDESIAEISDKSKKKVLEEEIKKTRNERDVNLPEKAGELVLTAASEDKGFHHHSENSESKAFKQGRNLLERIQKEIRRNINPHLMSLLRRAMFSLLETKAKYMS
jgi:hypothetical protein